jgi:NitT/TauT family transport system ATP-binding protein
MYREVLGNLGNSVPAIDSRIEGLRPEKFIDGRRFVPDDIPGYVAGFDIRNGINASIAE